MTEPAREHSLQLDEEEQLQIALALSAEEARESGKQTSTAEDEALARQLQDAEYAAAAQHVPPAAGPPPAGGSSPYPAPTVPSAGGSRLTDSLRAAGSGAMQRLSSGSQQLWQGVRRMVDQPPPPQPQPYYPPPPPGQPHYPQHPAQHPAQHPPTFTQPPQQQQQQQQPRSQMSEDEALALALQRQFDLEEQQLAQQAQQAQQQQAQAPPPRPAMPTGPLGANLPPVAAAAAGWQPGVVPPAAPAHAARPPAVGHPVVPGAAPLAVDRSRCAGCGGSLVSLLSRQPYITALGRHWHVQCLLCAGCGRPIAERGGVRFVERQGQLFHAACHKQRFHPRCDVCGDYVPEQANRRIVWSEQPFWKQRYCPSHADDGTPRCAGCDRLQPRGEEWGELHDSRQLCLSCLGSVVTDTRDAQPLWQNVLSYFASLGMSLPAVPPMMLVDSSALNDAEARETRGKGRGGGPVFHVRGLTLTEEYRSLRSVLRLPGGNPFAVRSETVQVGPTRHEVTAILVLFGLPRLLTGCILAHECTHAYLRMSGFAAHCHLPPQVEEGLCQLMALLWLEAQQDSYRDVWEERLAAFLGNQIRTDQSEVYGDGFRMALEAYQAHGLVKLLAHVRQAGAFPPSA